MKALSVATLLSPSHSNRYQSGGSDTQNVPRVEEDELHVQAGSEHEHVAVQLDLCHGAGRQRVADGHQADVLVAAVKRRHVQAVLTDLQVAAAVDHLDPKRQPQSDRRRRRGAPLWQ